MFRYYQYKHIRILTDQFLFYDYSPKKTDKRSLKTDVRLAELKGCTHHNPGQLWGYSGSWNNTPTRIVFARPVYHPPPPRGVAQWGEYA
jgi:hypothetical protein